MSPPFEKLNGLTIRGYTPADWPEVCRIHDRARVQELACGGVDPRAFRTMESVAQADEFFASETLVACAGSMVVGFISWSGAYITWLYVKPTHQQRGVGRLLLLETLQRIGPEAWTNIIAENKPALALFRHCGMELVRTRPGDCDGYACDSARLALPTSRMREPAARRESQAV
jgi:ribosomal protein S18 acetylase RimI-like enzyme